MCDGHAGTMGAPEALTRRGELFSCSKVGDLSVEKCSECGLDGEFRMVDVAQNMPIGPFRAAPEPQSRRAEKNQECDEREDDDIHVVDYHPVVWLVGSGDQRGGSPRHG